MPRKDPSTSAAPAPYSHVHAGGEANGLSCSRRARAAQACAARKVACRGVAARCGAVLRGRLGGRGGSRDSSRHAASCADAACPISTGGETRRVQLVRGVGRGYVVGEEGEGDRETHPERHNLDETHGVSD